MIELKVILAVLGAITGTVALVWRIIDEFGSFLRISLKVGWVDDCPYHHREQGGIVLNGYRTPFC